MAKKNQLSSKKRLAQILSILHKNHITRGIDPVKLRLIIEDLGPTFVKIGQIMSQRQDMFSQRYCSELEKLRTEVAPLEFSIIKQIVEEEYGCEISKVFSSFDEIPLGSASIAQVHHATLLDGQQIVVKVQRPNIYQMMERDIALVRRAANILHISEVLGSVVNINTLLDEFWYTAQEEMDFSIEARNAIHFQELHKDLKYISTPKIYREFSTTKVLVMEYIDGYDIDEIMNLKSSGYDMQEIAKKLADNYIKQIVDDGFFHADPHPGNIRIRDGKIVWIDFGMMGQLDNHDKELMRQGVKALVLNDPGMLTDVILALGVHDNQIDYPKLLGEMDVMMKKYLTMEFSSINLGEAIQEIFTIAHKHRISMPKGISMLARGMVTIESTLMVLDPKTNLIKIAATHMTSSLKDIDFKKEARNYGRKAYEASNHLLDIPVQMSDLLRMAMRGQFKVNLDLVDSKEPISRLDRMVNRVVICILAAALLMGSSVICATDMTPKIFGIPALGFIGYVGAVFMGLWLLIKMLFLRRRDKGL